MTETIGKIIVVVESKEKEFNYEELGVTFDSSSEEILKAVQPAILEATGINIEEDDESLYVVKKIEDSKNCFIFPKSPAGDKMKLEKLETEEKAYTHKYLEDMAKQAEQFGIVRVREFLSWLKWTIGVTEN